MIIYIRSLNPVAIKDWNQPNEFVYFPNFPKIYSETECINFVVVFIAVACFSAQQFLQ